MLALFLAVSLQQVPEHLQIEVGEAKVVKVGTVQRLLISGATLYEARFSAPDGLELIGHREGKSTVMGWRTDGSRFSFSLTVVAKAPKAKSKPVKVTKRRAPAEVAVFEFPETVEEITEVREVDGGLLLVGRSGDGQRLEIVVTPAPR